ncbi:Unknown protein sequence [Pseudomonas coronafaciens pv. oryzae]|nr:Unknown protein sequence [Pseudomonas coronafaciens pv. oryzae]
MHGYLLKMLTAAASFMKLRRGVVYGFPDKHVTHVGTP